MKATAEIVQLWQGFSYSLLYIAQSAIEGEASILPAGTLIMSGVADADWNWAFLYGLEQPEIALAAFVARLKERGLPAVLMAASPIASQLERVSAELGLARTDPKPLMLTQREVVLPPHPSGLRFTIERIGDEAAFAEALVVSGQAWGTAADVMQRVYRPVLLEQAGVEVYAALFEGEMVSYVCSTVVGDVVWLGDLGTVPAHRGEGAAAALLNGVMASHRERGRTVFGLGADPGAVGLYERLGFETVDRAPMGKCS